MKVFAQSLFSLDGPEFSLFELRSFRFLGFLVLVVCFTSSTVVVAQNAPSVASQKQTTLVTKKKSTTPASRPTAPELDPKAVEILKATSSRLAAARTLSFTAVETFESLSRQASPLVYATKSEVTLQRPDKLRVIASGDGPASEFYYDGKVMLAFAPAENLVAVANAPPSIDATLEAAYHSAAIYFPFTDLIVTDPYKDLAPGMQLAYYVGQSKVVGDTTTDIVAYIGDGVFIQVWIGVDDRLPRAVHAVYLNDPAQLRHNLLFSNWQINPSVSADAFTSSKAAGAKRMEFAHPHPEPPAQAVRPAKAKSSNPPKSQ